MNKRIHEITVQALENSLFEPIDPTVTVGEGENKVTIPLVFAEKFADLIVRKCIESTLSLHDIAIDNQWDLDETFHVIVDTIVEDLDMQYIFRS
jgi:hypothetical protein